MLLWADRLRNLATFLVIAIHVSGPVAEEYKDLDSWHWWSGNFWDALGRPAVPLFVMLSGFLLLGKDVPTFDFLKKRTARIAWPALFWLTVYSVYNHFAHGNPAQFWDYVKNLLEGPVHYHLWFLYLIVGIYLTVPILRPWVKQATERDYLYFFAVCIVGTWVYKVLAYFFNTHIGLYFELFTNQTGHFVLGYYLGNKVCRGETPTVHGIKPWKFTAVQLRRYALAAIVVGTAMTALGTYIATKVNGGVFHKYFYDYLTFNVGLSAIGWFVFAQYSFNGRPLLAIEKELAAASFGIYLVHVLVMDWWSQVGYWHSKLHPAGSIPVTIALVLLVSFTFVQIIRAFPGGQKIT
jgi:surface polysaccharide O-acyltransferase-like enzyme